MMIKRTLFGQFLLRRNGFGLVRTFCQEDIDGKKLKLVVEENFDDSKEILMKEESQRQYRFSSYRLIRLSQDVNSVKDQNNLDWLKLFVHASMTTGLVASGYHYIAPIFCWFASSSIIRCNQNDFKISK